MNGLNLILRKIIAVVALIGWVMGTVLAKGFWLTALSICFPFYSWYLVIEKIMINSGFLI